MTHSRSLYSPSKEGAFVCIVGSSGVGKDSLLAEARKKLIGDNEIVFPRRLVTRAKNEAEDHDTISEEDFQAGTQSGEFCLHWRAHNLGYALPHSVEEMVREGKTVVCNVSRSVITEISSKFSHIYVVLITAPPEIIAQRLRQRGRETEESIKARLQHNQQSNEKLSADVTITNTDTLENGANTLIKALQQIHKLTAAVN